MESLVGILAVVVVVWQVAEGCLILVVYQVVAVNCLVVAAGCLVVVGCLKVANYQVVVGCLKMANYQVVVGCLKIVNCLVAVVSSLVPGDLKTLSVKILYIKQKNNNELIFFYIFIYLNYSRTAMSSRI